MSVRIDVDSMSSDVGYVGYVPRYASDTKIVDIMFTNVVRMKDVS